MTQTRKRIKKTTAANDADVSTSSTGTLMRAFDANRSNGHQQESDEAQHDVTSISSEIATLKALLVELEMLRSGENADKTIEIAALIQVIEEVTEKYQVLNAEQEVRVALREKLEAELKAENAEVASVIDQLSSKKAAFKN